MAGQRINIMEIRNIIAFKIKKISNRGIASLLQINRKTVDSYIHRIKTVGLSYEEASSLSDAELIDLFTQTDQTDKDRFEYLASNFGAIEKELTKPGCTLQTLWRTYIEQNPDGYRYTQFTYHYRKWKGLQKISGKLEHKAGEKLFIDYCGQKLYYVDKETGEKIDVEVFIAVLPCSQYCFVHCSHSQKREDFIGSLQKCLRWIGGVPLAIVSDNLKSAVSRGSKYAPEINKTLAGFALHYGCAIDPARPHHPCDKSLVERSVKLVYQRIFYPINKMTFFSLEQLNQYIAGLLTAFNDYLFSHGGGSRRSYFLELEKDYLQPLPQGHYCMRQYRRAKVQKIAHIFLSEDKNYYSVPYRYIGLYVEVQYTRDYVEVFYNHERIAAHKRSYKPGQYTTVGEHMPSSHQFYQNWSPEFFQREALKIGPACAGYIKRLIEQYNYPEIGYKQDQGIIALQKLYSNERIESACILAGGHEKSAYRIIVNILENKKDMAPPAPMEHIPIPQHKNIRGPQSYR